MAIDAALTPAWRYGIGQGGLTRHAALSPSYGGLLTDGSSVQHGRAVPAGVPLHDPGIAPVAMELKVWRKGGPDPLAQGLVKLDGYLERLGLDRGVLVLFDRRPEAPALTERVQFEQATSPSGGR